MREVNARIKFSQPFSDDPVALLEAVNTLIRVLSGELISYGDRLNEALVKDGTEPMENPLPLKQFATVDLPAANLWEGAIVYDSTTNQFKGSDGATWNVL